METRNLVAVYCLFWRSAAALILACLSSVPPFLSSFCCPSAGHIIGLTAPPVGRTHTIIRLQTRIRRKDGTENFGGFVYVLDLHNGISCCGFFVCSINFSLSFPATTPRATTPHRYPTGYHALTTTARLSRLCIYPGYHAIV